MLDEKDPPQTVRLLSRRHFMGALAAVGSAPILTGVYAWRVEPHWVEFVRRDLPIAGLPDALEGRRLVQLSDLHIGPLVDSDYVIDTFDRVSALDPDLVAITGDWITYRGPAVLEELQRVLAHVPHGRLATFGVLGNHDYGRGWRMPDVADRVVAIGREAGITVLRNEAADVRGFRVIGFEDLWSPRFGPGDLVARHDDAAAVVLCHNPDAADRPVWGGYQGWILAGHTHGGQCRPPFLPPLLLPVRNRRYTAGAIDLGDGRHLYISRGVGHLIRVRFNVRPEVTVFTLRRA